MKHVILIGCVVVCWQGPAYADTNVGGVLSGNVQWTTASGPYVVTDDIVLTGGGTLTIDPGVEVRFAPETRLKVDNGTLIARGTEASRIRFTTNTAGELQDEDRWNTIWFADGAVDATFDASGNYVSGSVIEYATIENAGRGEIQGTYAGSAVYIGNAAPYISHNLFRNNSRRSLGMHQSKGIRVVGNTISNNPSNAVDASHSRGHFADNVITDNVSLGHGTGVKIHYSELTFSGNTISNNVTNRPTGQSAGGIFSQGSIVTFTGDRIIGNIGGGFVCDSYSTSYPNQIVLSLDPDNPTWIYGNDTYNVRNEMGYGGSADPNNDRNIDGRNVWWGTLDDAEIQAGIYDHLDNSAKGYVLYDPPAIPEPATLSLLTLGGLAVVRRRKRLALTVDNAVLL